MVIGLNRTKTISFQKRMKRKEIMDNIKDIFYFFERMFLLVKFAVLKVLSLLTIPFLIIGCMGAYNCYKLIIDTINNDIALMQSNYFEKTYQFLGIYLFYTFVKMVLECNLERK